VPRSLIVSGSDSTFLQDSELPLRSQQHREYARQDREFPIHRCGFSRPTIASDCFHSFDFEILKYLLINFIQSLLSKVPTKDTCV